MYANSFDPIEFFYYNAAYAAYKKSAKKYYRATMDTSQKQQKNTRGMVAAILWIIAPAALYAVSSQLWTAQLPIWSVPTLMWFPAAILIGLEIFIFRYYIQSLKQRDLILSLGAGLILQILLFGVITGWQKGTFFLIFLFGPSLILLQLSVAVILDGAYFLFKKSERFVRSLAWLALIVLIGCSILPYFYLQWKLTTHSGNPSAALDLTYNMSEVAFRQAAKIKTTLGSYPRPLRIEKNSSGRFIGITPANKTVPLPFLDALPLTEGDLDEKPFFDIFHDRVFYVHKEKAYVFNIITQQTKLLPDSIQKALKEETCSDFGRLRRKVCYTRSIIGAHADTLALSLVATQDIAVFNIKTGERIAQTFTKGYDISRLYLLWVDGKGYRLIVDSKGEPTFSWWGYAQSFQTQTNTMRIYLEDHPEPYPTEDGFDDWRFRSIVFSGGTSFYFKDKTPLLTVATTFPNAKIPGDTKFAVRNVYNLGKGMLGIEIENKLVIVDTGNKTARDTADAIEIENLLSQATLLASDDEQQFRFSCPYTNEVQKSVQEQKNKFVFCLL